ncbi:MAG: hypothetical protein U5K31_12600 [Balneolaceae bacterium]|nr:hypothetical protein [Balneolaceae bacterium]
MVWDLSELYGGPDDPQLAADREAVLKEAGEFASRYRGRVVELDAGSFREMLRSYEQLLDTLGRIGSYAHLLWTTDTTRAEYGKLLQQARELSRKCTSSWYSWTWSGCRCPTSAPAS